MSRKQRKGALSNSTGGPASGNDDIILENKLTDDDVKILPILLELSIKKIKDAKFTEKVVPDTAIFLPRHEKPNQRDVLKRKESSGVIETDIEYVDRLKKARKEGFITFLNTRVNTPVAELGSYYGVEVAYGVVNSGIKDMLVQKLMPLDDTLLTLASEESVQINLDLKVDQPSILSNYVKDKNAKEELVHLDRSALVVNALTELEKTSELLSKEKKI